MVTKATDPEVLEAEAEALIKEMQDAMKGQQAPPADTPEAQPQQSDEQAPPAQEETPETADDVREEPGKEDAPEPSDDEVVQLREKLNLSEERYRNAQRQMTKASQEAAALRKEKSELVQRIADLEAELASRPEAKDESELAIEQLAADYPELAGPLVAHLRKVQEQLKGVAKQADDRAKEAERERHFAAIEARHPDFATVVETDKFRDWLTEQTASWKRIAQTGTADEVSDLLDRYKDAAGKATSTETPSQRAARVAEPVLPRGRSPQVTGKRIYTRAEIANMPIDEFMKHEADIDAAMKEGRVR